MLRLLLALVVFAGLVREAGAQAIAVSLTGRAMPSMLTADGLRWADQLTAAVLNACPLARGTTYYFAQSGNDTTGNGSEATPWQTIAKAQTTLTASSGNIALVFKRGDTWEEQTGLNVDKNNVTVGAYGSTGARPLWNNFANKFASGGTLWTLASGNRYTTTVADIGGIREQLNRLDKAYRKVSSTGEVESTPNSYYWASNTLHLHATNAAGTAVDPDTIAFEYTLAAATDDSGIDVAAGVTGVRIDSIRCDGWGLDGAAVNQEYGIKAQTSGTNVVAVTNCEAYYSARHNLGHNAGAAASGGFVLWSGCRYGYCTEPVAATWVSYCGLGGQEDVVIGCEAAYGSLPASATRNFVEGEAGLCHTNGGSYYVALQLLIDNLVSAPANGFGCHIGYVTSNPSAAPPAVTPADCKHVQIGTRMDKAVGTGGNGGSVGHMLAQPNCLEIGGRYQFVPLNCTSDSIASIAPTGWTVNTAVEIDLTNAGMTESVFGLYNPVVTANAPKFWGCHVNVISNGTTDFALNFRRALDLNEAHDASAEFVGGVYSVRRTNPASTADVIRVGMPNTATAQRRNAYFGLSADSANVGSASAANTITLGSLPAFAGAAFPASPLLAGGEGGLCEYDLLRRSRHPTAPAIGPLEVASQELQRPTAAEIVALIEGGDVGTRLSELVTDTSDIALVANTVNTKLGTPAGASVSADIAAIESQTDDIGVAGAGLTALASQASVDAIEVGETQPRVNRKPDPAFTVKVSRRADGTHKATSPVRITPGAIDGVFAFVDVSPVFGADNFVRTVGTPSVEAGGSITASAEGPRDTYAVIELDGTATASEERTITVPVTMDSGTTINVVFDVVVFAQ